MSPERWARVRELYHALCELSAEQRAAALSGVDAEFKAEIEALFAQPDDSLLDRPILEYTTSVTGAQLAKRTEFGPYRIEPLLGTGGMGHVYKATDTRLGRAVAIKMARGQFNLRFEREALASLNHPHICTLYDIGPDYLVMEYIEGETLAARLKRGHLALDDVVKYGTEIADALTAAHAHGITHRDLKPGNLMLILVLSQDENNQTLKSISVAM